MKKYQAMIILALPAAEQTLEDKLERLRADITKLGGVLEHTTRLGRQAFMRPLKKKDAGFYVLITFSLDPAKIATLSERYKLNADIFRVQITLAPPPVRENGAKASQREPEEAVKKA